MNNEWKGWKYFFTNNTDFTFWAVVIIAIAGITLFILYGHQQREIGREEMKGTVILQEGIVNPTPEQKIEAVKQGYKNTLLTNPKTGENVEILSRKTLPTALETNPLKFVGAVGLEGIDVGLGYEIYDFNVPLVGNMNVDFPIIMLEHWGGGISKDITPDMDAGLGAFKSYNTDEKMLMGYLTKKF